MNSGPSGEVLGSLDSGDTTRPRDGTEPQPRYGGPGLRLREELGLSALPVAERRLADRGSTVLEVAGEGAQEAAALGHDRDVVPAAGAGGVDRDRATSHAGSPAVCVLDGHLDTPARFDATWHLKDNGAVVLGGCRASGSPGPDPNGYLDSVAEVVARRVTSADNAPAGSQSVVTVTASATRPA